jgi:hypothetical protein
MTQTSSRTTSGYPLVALFLLLTACGIIAALVGPAARAISAGEVGWDDALLAAILSSVGAAGLGAVIGMFHYRRGRGLLWGLLVGSVIGVFLGPLMLAPASSFGSVIALSFGGAAVIVLVMVMFHVTSRR